MNTSQNCDFPVVIAFRACSSGFSYSLLYFQRKIHLAESRQGELRRFLHLSQKNLCHAFGDEGGNKVWHSISAMRNLKHDRS
jgi:hypothetical protein